MVTDVLLPGAHAKAVARPKCETGAGIRRSDLTRLRASPKGLGPPMGRTCSPCPERTTQPSEQRPDGPGKWARDGRPRQRDRLPAAELMGQQCRARQLQLGGRGCDQVLRRIESLNDRRLAQAVEQRGDLGAAN